MPIFVGYSGEWTPIKDLYGKGASGEWEAAEAVYVGVNGEWVLVEDEYVPPPTHPTVIGEFFGGGYYIGNVTIPEGEDQGTYAVIMAGLEGQASLRSWKTTNTSTTGTTSTTNGMSNTLAMEAAGISLHPAARHCLNYRGSDFSDWYLGAKDELELAWVNRGELAAAALASSVYWTSTQSSASDAYRVNFGAGPGLDNKLNQRLVRPVRRIRLPNP